MTPAFEARWAGQLLGLIALVAGSTPALAQWEIRERSNEQPPVATVRGTRGEVFRVLTSPTSGTVVGMLVLQRGLVSLADAGCPTFKVDDKAPDTFSDAGSCSVAGRSATFVLGEVAEQRVKSRALREMINGRELVVMYRFDGHGYDEARFALAGSAQALTAALGNWKLTR